MYSLSVFKETADFGNLQRHAEDHQAGSRRGRQEVPQRLGQRGVQEEQERHKPGEKDFVIVFLHVVHQ